MKKILLGIMLLSSVPSLASSVNCQMLFLEVNSSKSLDLWENLTYKTAPEERAFPYRLILYKSVQNNPNKFWSENFRRVGLQEYVWEGWRTEGLTENQEAIGRMYLDIDNHKAISMLDTKYEITESFEHIELLSESLGYIFGARSRYDDYEKDFDHYTMDSKYNVKILRERTENLIPIALKYIKSSIHRLNKSDKVSLLSPYLPVDSFGKVKEGELDPAWVAQDIKYWNEIIESSKLTEKDLEQHLKDLKEEDDKREPLPRMRVLGSLKSLEGATAFHKKVGELNQQKWNAMRSA